MFRRSPRPRRLMAADSAVGTITRSLGCAGRCHGGGALARGVALVVAVLLSSQD